MPEFAYYELVNDWPELVIAINGLEARLRTAKRPVAADMLLRGFQEFRKELLAMGRAMAAFATEELRKTEHDTRVRPDTQGGGGPRLGDNLIARPIDEGLLPGSIGVADKDLLDAEVPWWPTNEVGSNANIGRRLFGVFYGNDDAGPPDADRFREHPLFEPGPNGTLAGVGFIENPIPARYFIRDAIPAINVRWQDAFRLAKANMDRVITDALATYR